MREAIRAADAFTAAAIASAGVKQKRPRRNVDNIEKRLADLLVAGKVTDPMATIAELMGRTARKR